MRPRTKMPFSPSFRGFDPYRVSLLDERVPVAWRLAFDRIAPEIRF